MTPLPYSDSSNGWHCSIEKAGERIDQDLKNQERDKVVVNQAPQYEDEEAPQENSGRSFLRHVKENAFL